MCWLRECNFTAKMAGRQAGEAQEMLYELVEEAM
jgi:hypothetical protein